MPPGPHHRSIIYSTVIDRPALLTSHPGRKLLNTHLNISYTPFPLLCSALVCTIVDMFEDMNEINDMMGRSYSNPEDIDEVPILLNHEHLSAISVLFILPSLLYGSTFTV